jgi:2-oxoglutarate ferredoxin oxidoreductase subunit beta
MRTSFQVEGVSEEPFNPLVVALALDASFVARTFSGDIEHMKETFKSAINHKGFFTCGCIPTMCDFQQNKHLSMV